MPAVSRSSATGASAASNETSPRTARSVAASEPPAVREALCLGSQFGILAGFCAQGVEFLQLESQQVDAGFTVRVGTLQCPETFEQRFPFGESARRLRPQVAKAAVVIQYVTLNGAPAE